MRPALGQGRRIGVVGLAGVAQRSTAGQFGQARLPGIGRGAVVFRQQAIHIDTPDTDAETATTGLDAKAVRGDARHHVAAVSVQGAGLDAPGQLGDPFVPVGVQLDPTLLHDDAEEVAAGVEADSTQIEAHDAPSGFVEDAGTQAHSQVFRETDTQVADPLCAVQLMEDAHFAFIVRALQDFQRGR